MKDRTQALVIGNLDGSSSHYECNVTGIDSIPVSGVSVVATIANFRYRVAVQLRSSNTPECLIPRSGYVSLRNGIGEKCPVEGANIQQPTANSQQPTANSQQPTANSQ
ncbi:MAG: hypothetical protein U0T82_15460 [Bacteroidales bacterium]